MSSVMDVINCEPDWRTADKFLVNKLLVVLSISCGYLCLIKVILPKVMKNRRAFDTERLSLWLNIYLLSTACYFFYKCVMIGWFTTIKWNCEPIDRSTSEASLEVD